MENVQIWSKAETPREYIATASPYRLKRVTHVSCYDDATVKLWDWEPTEEELAEWVESLAAEKQTNDARLAHQRETEPPRHYKGPVRVYPEGWWKIGFGDDV